MPVFEFKMVVAPERVSALEDALAEHEEQRFMVIEDKPANAAWLAGYFESHEAAETAWREFSAAAGMAGEALPEVRQLPDADWKESYKAHFKAWRFGTLNWVPIWERATFKLGAGEQVLWLDPGMAFGTGNHETTRLVVERLVDFAERRGVEGSVIDAGCGSGILALSAAKLGFQRIAAFDNDPLAVEVSAENARLNDLVDRVDFYVGDLTTGLAGKTADIVLANIQADVLIRFAKELVRAVAPGGVLVLSGILARENAEVRTAFARVAPEWETDSRVMGEWSDLTIARR